MCLQKGFSGWENSHKCPQVGTTCKVRMRVAKLAPYDAETGWTKVNIGFYQSCFTNCTIRASWLLKYRKQLSTRCCSLWAKKNTKPLLFGVDVAPTFQHNAHEHTEEGRATSQLGKMGPPGERLNAALVVHARRIRRVGQLATTMPQ